MQTDIFTDLAVEAAAQAPADAAGVQSHTAVQGALRITRLEITSQAGEAALGRPQGRYYTAEIPDALGQGDDDYDQAAHTLAELLAELLPEGDGCLLVAGLGNEGVTPDALGPETASRVLVTRHLTTSGAKLAELFRAVAVVCPGVLGQTGLESAELPQPPAAARQTGLESAELLRGAAATVRPVAILAIDALAARSLARLGNTVQLTDTGLLPGGGIGNSRQELSFRTMGVPVVGIGVPTVISAGTLVQDVLADLTPNPSVSPPMGRYSSLYVAPKEIDSTNRRLARLLADAINLALQPSLSLEDLRYYLEG